MYTAVVTDFSPPLWVPLLSSCSSWPCLETELRHDRAVAAESPGTLPEPHEYLDAVAAEVYFPLALFQHHLTRIAQVCHHATETIVYPEKWMILFISQSYDISSPCHQPLDPIDPPSLELLSLVTLVSRLLLHGLPVLPGAGQALSHGLDVRYHLLRDHLHITQKIISTTLISM